MYFSIRSTIAQGKKITFAISNGIKFFSISFNHLQKVGYQTHGARTV